MKIPRSELAHDGGCGEKRACCFFQHQFENLAGISIYVLVLAPQLAANASYGHVGIAALGTVMVEHFHCLGPGQTF